MFDENEYPQGTLKDIAKGQAKKQDHLVNNLTEKAPIVDNMSFQPTTHGMWNVYQELTHIDSLSEVDIDAPVPDLGVDSELKKVDLQIVAGKIFLGEDKAANMGKEKYFADMLRPLTQKAGMDMEQRIIYKNFVPFAVDHKKVINSGGTSNNNYSIIAYREIEGENIGLYNPKGFGNGSGKLIDVKAINNGALYENEKGIMGYGIRLKGYIGLQLANKDGIAMIANIDKTHIPTADMIDDVLYQAGADDIGKIRLYMHPKVLSLLNKYKGDLLRMSSNENGINRKFNEWNGVPIITSRNFLNGTEQKITVE